MSIFSKPKPPDPGQVTQQQTALNTAATEQNLKQQGQTANKTGPFGSTTTQIDPNTGLPTGQTSSLNSGLNSNGLMSAFGSQVGTLPTAAPNFDMTTAQNIAQGNYGAYSAMTAPQRAQAQNSLNTTLSDRGIPLGSEIDNNERGNMDRANSIADTNAAAQAWNAVPGMQATMTNTAIQQGLAPGNQAGQSLGLLSGLNGLTPNVAGITPQQIAPANYGQAAQNQFQGEQQNYQNLWGGIGNLAGVGLLGAFSPSVGQNFGKSLAGQAYNGTAGLFNSSYGSAG